MKSFTRNQTNIQALRSDIRFDALVKKEMVEHQHIISYHHKEMQELRDTIKISMERIESLSKHGDDELKNFRIDISCHVNTLKEKLSSHDSIISEQKKTIQDLHKQLQDFHVIYSSKDDVEKFKKYFDSQINNETTKHLNALQELQMELKMLFQMLKDDLSKSKFDTEKKFNELIDRIERNFNVNKIDREGVLKEIRIYDKTIFIIEKKLENIYTLIERINKKGEL